MLAAAVPGARWRRARVTAPGRRPRDLPLAGTAGPDSRNRASARSSGLTRLARPDPMGAQTTGLGEVLGRALDAGADRILAGLGGSAATDDGGAGALAALGARFLDAAGQPLPPGRRGAGRAGPGGSEPAATAPGRRGDLPDRRHRATARPARCGGRLRAAEGRGRRADRPAGNGAGPAGRVARRRPGCPGAGAAGGTGYGLAAAWGAILTPGAAELTRLAGLDRALTGSTWSSPARDDSMRPR